MRSSARNSRLLFWEVNIPEPFELRKNIVDIAFQASAAGIDVVRMRQRALELGNLGCQFAHALFLGRGLPRLHDAFTAEMLRRTLARESKIRTLHSRKVVLRIGSEPRAPARPFCQALGADGHDRQQTSDARCDESRAFHNALSRRPTDDSWTTNMDRDSAGKLTPFARTVRGK